MAESVSASGIGEEFLETNGERGRIARFAEKSTASGADEFGERGDVGLDNRDAAGERLDDIEAKGFAV